jgi:2'-5' RNA ligase
MRTFIAIEIPEGIKQEMAKAQEKLKASGVEAGWTRPEGIHLTLKFLGDVPEAKVPDIRAALTGAVQNTGAFDLAVAGAGAFPNGKNARVAWLGVTGDLDRLSTLQARVEDAMEKVGFGREDRPFTPHLTLARIKYIRSRDRWLATLESIKDIRLPGFTVEHVRLMKSELRPSGAVYTEMAVVPLK